MGLVYRSSSGSRRSLHVAKAIANWYSFGSSSLSLGWHSGTHSHSLREARTLQFVQNSISLALPQVMSSAVSLRWQDWLILRLPWWRRGTCCYRNQSSGATISCWDFRNFHLTHVLLLSSSRWDIDLLARYEPVVYSTLLQWLNRLMLLWVEFDSWLHL